MATTDPISKTLLDLFGAYSDRRQAQLDLERAQAKEATLGRTAIPGVMAELQARAEKEAAKKAKIAKAEEAGQPNPAAQVPQFTQITGQPDVRSTANALKSAADIAATVSGGRGVKTGAIQPGVIQGQFGQAAPAGVGQGINPAAPQPGAPAQGGAAVAPQGPSTQTTTTPITEPLSKRLFRSVLDVAGARVGAGGLGASILPHAGSVSVTTRVPGPGEEAERIFKEAEQEAATLIPLLREGQSKVGTPEAGKIGQRVVENITDIQKRRGEDVAKEAVRQAGLGVLAIEQEERAARKRALESAGLVATRQEEAEIRREERQKKDPEERVRDREAIILEKIADGKAISKDEQNFLDTRARLDPIQRAVNAAMGQALSGAGAKPLTDADAATLMGDLTTQLGREPTGPEIQAEITRRGFVLEP